MESHSLPLTLAPSRPKAAPRAAAAQWDSFAVLYGLSLLAVSVSPSLGGYGTLLRITCAGLGALALVVVLLEDHGNIRLRGVEQAALACLIGALAMAAVSPIGWEYASSRTVNWLMFWPLVIVFVHRPRFKALAAAAIAVGLIQTVGVILQSRGVLGGVWGGAIISGSDYNPLTSRWLSRYTGFVQNPNDLGILMSVSVFAALAVLVSSRRMALRVFALAVIIVSLFVVVSTGSRGGLLAVGIGSFVFALVMGAKGVAAFVGSAVLAVYVAATVRWEPLDAVLKTLVGAAQGRDFSVSERFDIWQSYHQSPTEYVFGMGFGGYNPDALRGSGFNVDSAAAIAATVDNGWFKLLLEGGALGVLAVIFVLFLAFAGIWRSRGAPALRVERAAIAAVLTALVWRSLSIDSLDTNPYNAVLPLTIGAAFALGRLGADARPPTT